MSYLPVLLGLSTAFCWGTSDFLSRKQSERAGHYNTSVYMLATNVVILLALIPVLHPPVGVTLEPALLLVAAGALNFFAFMFLYRSIHEGVVSLVAPVAYSYPVVTTILTVLLLGAVLAPIRGVAIAGVIVGVILVSTRFSELGSYVRKGGLHYLTAGVGSALASAFMFGIVFVVLGYVAPTVGYFVPAVFLRAVAMAVGFLAAPAFKANVRPSRSTVTPTLLVISGLEVIGFLSFSLGASLGVDSLPIVTAISGMGGAMAASYGLIILREKLEKNQMAGVVLSLVGVFVLLYLGS